MATSIEAVLQKRSLAWIRKILEDEPNFFKFASTLRKTIGPLSWEEVSNVYRFAKKAFESANDYGTDFDLELKNMKELPQLKTGRRRTVITADILLDCEEVPGVESTKIRVTVRMPGTPSRSAVEMAILDQVIAMTMSDQGRFAPYEECQVGIERYVSIYQTR